MSNFLNTEIFDGKTTSDILKEIYQNSRNKKKQINGLINSLTPMMEGIGDAAVVVPLIKEYLEVGVKNDEHLIKMMAIVQRMGNSDVGDSTLTNEELEQLQLIAENMNNNELKTIEIPDPVKRIEQ